MKIQLDEALSRHVEQSHVLVRGGQDFLK